MNVSYNLKLLWFLCYFCLSIDANVLIKSIGCADSEQIHQLYASVEKKFALFIKYFGKLLRLTVTVIFPIPVTFPIAYAIFGYPPPDLWTTPLETQ